MGDMSVKSSSAVAGTSEGHGHGYGIEEFDGCTLLHLACETADVGMIELLLQYGAIIMELELYFDLYHLNSICRRGLAEELGAEGLMMDAFDKLRKNLRSHI
ncbi:ADP-ribosylation factor GTPase-activating protein AGD3 [Artemisia annua]|uniref:ADP-ribosylation factor GTPase-activating protein AGD3 n=1 Tax=Artemisia annua TaxID=35608 RepID=A0A2U1NM28_ARTAN|nr:ADP-ribosylation factor GTPase-activating protein AGD3 [Artemisia annua]